MRQVTKFIAVETRKTETCWGQEIYLSMVWIMWEVFLFVSQYWNWLASSEAVRFMTNKRKYFFASHSKNVETIAIRYSDDCRLEQL